MRSLNRDYDAVVKVGDSFHVFQDDEFFTYKPGDSTEPTPQKLEKDTARWKKLEKFRHRNIDAVWKHDSTTYYVVQGGKALTLSEGSDATAEPVPLSKMLNLVPVTQVPGQRRRLNPDLGIDAITRRSAWKSDEYTIFQDAEFFTFPVNSEEPVEVKAVRMDSQENTAWAGLRHAPWNADLDVVLEEEDDLGNTSGYLVFRRDQVLELDKDGNAVDSTNAKPNPRPIRERWWAKKSG